MSNGPTYIKALCCHILYSVLITAYDQDFCCGYEPAPT